MTPSTVYVCDSQPILVEGISSVLANTEEFRLVGASQTTAAALEEIRVPDEAAGIECLRNLPNIGLEMFQRWLFEMCMPFIREWLTDPLT